MKGFFNMGDVSASPYKSKKGMNTCVSCGLYKTVKTPRMKPYGGFKKELMVIGSFPEKLDDIKGVPFSSPSGQLLRKQYREVDIDLERDAVCLNAVNCCPVDNKGNFSFPTEHQISCCRQKILSAIDKYKPKTIILHGDDPLVSLIGYRQTVGGGIEKWRGWQIPDQDFKTWFCPTYSPYFIHGLEEQSEIQVLWKEDIANAVKTLEIPFPIINKNIITAQNMDEILDFYNIPGKPFAFDIETTGLRPYDTKKHKIYTISFCNNLNSAHAMPYPTKRRELKKLKTLLENPKVGKIAANMKYEDTWLNVISGISVNPWIFDTMQAAHVLDNRMNISGLKFQAYVNFGVLGYEDSVAPYIKSGTTDEVNRIEELIKMPSGMDDLLFYNGMDSLLEYRLALRQIARLGLKI